jgi:6-pyruvoyltetrahydropterin/6-carboxytetrahydropterin synthase
VRPPSDDDAPNEGQLTAVRRLQFCAGHRVQQHESKCRNLHGHNYVVFFHAVSDTGLDPLGRVIDFGVMKQRLGAFIDEQWDHGFILWREDREAIEAVQRVEGQKLSLLAVNPTAENMARHLLDEVCPRALDGTGVRIVKVVLWETENCFVEARSHVRR